MPTTSTSAFGVEAEGMARADVERVVAGAVSLLAEAGVEAETRIGSGDDRAVEILKASEAYDLTVLGVSGRLHMSRYLMGSVPPKIVEHSPASVMIVK